MLTTTETKQLIFDEILSNSINTTNDLRDLVTEKLKKSKNETFLNFVRDNANILTPKEMSIKLGVPLAKIKYLLNKEDLNLVNSFVTSEVVLLNKIAKNNTYTNSDGIKKENVRNILANEVFKSGVVGAYLGLPYYTATFEEKIYKENPKMTFVGCEIEKNTYLLRKKYNVLTDFPMVLHNTKLINLIRESKPNTYAHAFLDYMGGLKKFGQEILDALDNKIVMVGGTLAFTIQNAQRVGLVKSETIFKRKNDDRADSNRMINDFIYSAIGEDYELVSNNYYKDNGHVGMNLVILKRIK